MQTLLAIAILLDSALANLSFDDVSIAAGLDYSEGPWLKYGGAAVADLDADGCPDLLCGHHGGFGMEIYMNQCNGTFLRNKYRPVRDIHALTPVRPSVYEQQMHFIITPGGGRGANPEGSKIVRTMETNSFEDVTTRLGMTGFYQRGRGAVAINLRSNDSTDGYTDVIITSAPLDDDPSLHVPFKFKPPGVLQLDQFSGDFATAQATYVTAVDAKNDGIMDLLSLEPFAMYQVTAALTLDDISDSVFPKWNIDDELKGVAAVAEADFDNDGYLDLYLARAAVGDKSFRRRNGKEPDISDVLLRGTADGTYENVTVAAGIPLDLETRGVTVGDFDNDGWVDILLLIHTGKDLFLMNNADGTFTTVEANWDKVGNGAGDMATAVDYDRDGRLDLILSEGDWFDKSLMGYFRVMRNITPFVSAQADGSDSSSTLSNFLLVRVGSAKTLLATSLHAAVYLYMPDGLKLMRRVGAPGVAVSVSYIELLHFGIGSNQLVDRIQIVWTDGSSEELQSVSANQYIEVGIF